MKTPPCTRQWNHTVSRIRLLLFVLGFLQLAPLGTSLAQGTADTAGRVRPSGRGTLAFTKLLRNAQGRYDLPWVPQEYHQVIISRLQQRGFTVHQSQSALFNQVTPPGTRFILGGVVHELTCQPIQGEAVNTVYCGIAITWELFDQNYNTVVYKAKTRSYLQTSNRPDFPANEVGKLILDALDSLISRKYFLTAMSDGGLHNTNTTQYPFIDADDLTWQEQIDRQKQAAATERQGVIDSWQTQQRQWEEDTRPLRKKQKPYKITGVSLTIVGVLSMVTGGALVLQAAHNHDQVKEYRDQWRVTTDPNELEQLQQDIVDTEKKRDLQHAFGIGTLSAGTASLITGFILLSIMPKLPPKPVRPPTAKSPVRLLPVVGATDVGLRVTF